MIVDIGTSINSRSQETEISFKLISDFFVTIEAVSCRDDHPRTRLEIQIEMSHYQSIEEELSRLINDHEKLKGRKKGNDFE